MQGGTRGRRLSIHLLAALVACAVALAGARPARAICDVIPQPEVLFRGETGALNRVYASPGNPMRISLDTATGGCESASGSFGGALTDFNSYTLEGWSPVGPHFRFWVQDAGLGTPSLVGELFSASSQGARAPADFLGDWAARSVTQLSWIWGGFSSVTLSGQDVAQISGPGGSAAWRPALGFLPTSQAVQFVANVDTSAPTGDWVVTSGTWAGLMAQVDELILVGDLGFPGFFGDAYILDDIELTANGSTGSVATLLFEPPSGPANAVVIPSSGSCASLSAEITACTAALGGGTVTCRDDLAVSLTGDSLGFPMPDEGYAGPVTVAVTPLGAAFPCGLATTECGGPGAPTGLRACIDRFYASDGTCEADAVNRHPEFPGLTVLPSPNDFSGICDSLDVSIPCSNNNADVQFATDSDGNLVIPIDWRGVLVPGTLPIPRLVRASSLVAAFTGAPPEPSQTPGAPIAVPGSGFLQSFSPKGLRVDPLFNPLADEDASIETELFGSADAEFGVIRVLRRSPAFRQCDAGVRAALPCIADFECPASECVPALCRGGANDGKGCTNDTQCPDGECGAPLFDFSDRYSSGGSGPILLTSAEYDAEAQNPAAIDGLAATDELFAFVRSEPLEQKDLNQDGDLTDSTVVTLQDATTGDDAGLGIAPGAVGRAGVRARRFPFRFPAIAAEEDVLAFLEAEPEESGLDTNGDGDAYDTILRVFRVDTTPATELTSGSALAVDAEERIDAASLELSDGLVFVRLDELGGTNRVSAPLLSFGPVARIWGTHIMPDGRFVFFGTEDGTVVAGDNNGIPDLFVKDRDTDEDGIYDEGGATSIVRISVSTNGSEGVCTPGTCFPPFFTAVDVSADARWVVHSTILELDPNDTNGEQDLYLYDRDADEDGIFDEPGAISTQLLSADGLGNAAGPVWYPTISSSGRYVAFLALTDFLPGDTNGFFDIYAIDRDSDENGTYDEPGGTTFTQLIRSSGGRLDMAADGRYISFDTVLALVPEDLNGDSDHYLIDRDTDADGIYDEPGETGILQISATADGVGGDPESDGGAELSADGRYASFGTEAGNLVPGAIGGGSFVRDRDADENGIFDEPGGVDVRRAAATILTPEGRRAIGGNIGGLPTFKILDHETDLVADIGIIDEIVNEFGFGVLDVSSRAAYAVLPDHLSTDAVIEGADTTDLSHDWNGDGDALDVVLAVADARLPAPISITPLEAADEVAVAAGNAAFLRPEAADGAGIDLNGDGDFDDRAVQVWRNRQAGPAVNLGLAAEDVAISNQVVAALVSESGEGLLLNGDSDMDDLVVHVNDLATGTSGTWVNLSLAADDVQAAGPYVAFTVPEAAQGASLNGDGDQGDRVLRIYDASSASFVALQDEQGTPIIGMAVDDFVLDEQVVAFRVSEAGQGQNLNGVAPPIPGGVADGDLFDSVLHVADLATGTVYNGMQAAIPCPVEACDPRVPYRVQGTKVTHLTLEAEQGGNDLDQSGDAGTGLVLQHFNPDALAAGGSMLDACDVVGGALAGICTNTAESCASIADCGGETCYFPPGGCLFDSAVACDPSNPLCPGSQFCAPVLGMPGTHTCQEINGPCLTSDECAGGEVCIDDGANVEQLFAAVGDEPDGRQRFVSEGRCSDGDGSCRNDGDCNDGVMCDGAVTVIATAADPDADGLADPIDNCPDVTNDDQLDLDQDGIGDACDRLTCGNGVQEYTETCDHGDQNGIDGVCDALCQYEGVGVACDDGIDNDGDGQVDLQDPGCDDAFDVSERTALKACDDGRDNDGDYRVDVGRDNGCNVALSPREDPACSNGLDDDGDGKIDFDGLAGFYTKDPNCANAFKNSEGGKKGCGLGMELALLLPLLQAARRRRRSRICA